MHSPSPCAEVRGWREYAGRAVLEGMRSAVDGKWAVRSRLRSARRSAQRAPVHAWAQTSTKAPFIKKLYEADRVVMKLAPSRRTAERQRLCGPVPSGNSEESSSPARIGSSPAAKTGPSMAACSTDAISRLGVATERRGGENRRTAWGYPTRFGPSSVGPWWRSAFAVRCGVLDGSVPTHRGDRDSLEAGAS
jgi:hypothetical protein